MTLSTGYDGKSNLVGSCKQFYDDKGNLTSETWYDSEGKER